MIRLLIIVFALVAALGGGATGLIHFAVIPDFTGGLVTNLIGVQGAEAEKVEKEAPPPPKANPIYIQVDPVVVPIIKDGELKRNVYIAMRLEVTEETHAKVLANLERLHDVYLRALFEAVQDQEDEKNTLDLEPIRQRLLRITDRVVGPGEVNNIVFLSVFNR